MNNYFIYHKIYNDIFKRITISTNCMTKFQKKSMFDKNFWFEGFSKLYLQMKKNINSLAKSITDVLLGFNIKITIFYHKDFFSKLKIKKKLE